MISFILNNQLIKTDKEPASLLVDFIRYEKNLKGTKIGCREGDCGACTVLVGTFEDGSPDYQSLVSCLTPIANVHAKHVVTIEGINNELLTPVQKVLHDHSGTQCGFCTPGFVLSLTGYALSNQINDLENALRSVSGNICRCTGYKSIENAIKEMIDQLMIKPKKNYFKWLIDQNYIPDYFTEISERLEEINSLQFDITGQIIGGGTDLFVQRPDELLESEASFLINNESLKGIVEEKGIISVGASVTANEIMKSEIFQKYFPSIKKWFSLISSEQIRNASTLAGNFVNASPIGDMSIFFLALDAKIIISNNNNKDRQVDLKTFFKAYKVIDLKAGEYIKKIYFKVSYDHFNFEKVSKRIYLDIASVNTAISYNIIDNQFDDIHIAAGGIAPIPKYFHQTCKFLTGKEYNEQNINKALDVLLSEISPISDIRGSKEYKTLLLKQLFLCHFKTKKTDN